MKNYQNKAVETPKPKKSFTSARVDDYMVSAKDLTTFSPETNIMDVVDTLLSKRITGAPVLDAQGKVVGMIDDKDCLKVVTHSTYHNHPHHSNTCEHFMTDFMKTVPLGTDIFDVASTFLSSIYKRLLVVDQQGRLVGQISRRDILRAIRDVVG